MAQRRWLPRLEEELEIYRRTIGQLPPESAGDDSIRELRDALLELGPPTGPSARGLSDRHSEAWPEAGGWYRSDRSRAIRYRPRGHRDPFLYAWLELATALTSAEEMDAKETAAAPARVFGLLTRKNAPGRCTKCHSVDAAPSVAPESTAALSVNWRPHRRAESEHPPTRFAHRPHLSLENEERCLTCHAMAVQAFEAAEAEFESVYAGYAPHAGFVSDFEPMESTDCSSCHTREGAGEDCTTCHNYHWGQFASVYLSRPAVEQAKPQAESRKR